MATIGILGQIDIGAGAAANVYGPVPASTKAVITIDAVNRGAVSATIRLSLSAASATMAAAEFIEHGWVLGPSGSNENVMPPRSGLVLQAGKYVVAYSDVANVSFCVTGVEEAV